jgi:hypothetical protein
VCNPQYLIRLGFNKDRKAPCVTVKD